MCVQFCGFYAKKFDQSTAPHDRPLDPLLWLKVARRSVRLACYYDTDSKQGLLIKEQVPMGVSRIQGRGDRRGGATWGSCHPLEFENDDVAKSLEFLLAPWALASHALKFILKRRRNIRGNVRLWRRRAEKHAIFASPCAFAPSGKICNNFPFANVGTQNNKYFGWQSCPSENFRVTPKFCVPHLLYRYYATDQTNPNRSQSLAVGWKNVSPTF